MPVYDLICTGCRRLVEDVICKVAERNNRACPDCGERMGVKPTAALPINTGGEHAVGKFYPRYDRGLGMVVQSHAHRQRICLERNLIPLEGADFSSLEAAAGRMNTEHETALQTLAAIEDEYEHHPDYREFREDRHKGAYDQALQPARQDTHVFEGESVGSL